MITTIVLTVAITLLAVLLIAGIVIQSNTPSGYFGPTDLTGCAMAIVALVLFALIAVYFIGRWTAA